MTLETPWTKPIYLVSAHDFSPIPLNPERAQLVADLCESCPFPKFLQWKERDLRVFVETHFLISDVVAAILLHDPKMPWLDQG